jgi:hypothetical protein
MICAGLACGPQQEVLAWWGLWWYEGQYFGFNELLLI